jgi:hypothetical protein
VKEPTHEADTVTLACFVEGSDDTLSPALFDAMALRLGDTEWPIEDQRQRLLRTLESWYDFHVLVRFLRYRSNEARSKPRSPRDQVVATAGRSKMTSARSSALAAMGVLLLASFGGCADSDDAGGDVESFCGYFERGMTMLRDLDREALAAGDPDAMELAAELEEHFAIGQEINAPDEIRDAFERSIDPRAFEPVPEPEYAEASDEVLAYVVDNCDLPPDLRDELSDSSS